MPRVGKKDFSYDKKGMKAAKAYAKKTGQEMEYPSYDAGGRVERVMGYGDGGEVKK